MKGALSARNFNPRNICEYSFIGSNDFGINQAVIAQEYDINSLRAGAVNGDKI
jgi:hypothetical protein